MRSLAQLAAFLVAHSLVACLVGCASASPSAPPPASPADGVAPSRAAGVAAVDTSSEAAFTASGVRLFQEAAPELPARVTGPLQIGVTTPKGDMRVNLDRIAHLCEADAARCEAELRAYVAQSVAILRAKEAPIAKEALLPVVRDEAFFAQAGGPSKLLAEPLAAGLWVVYVVDSPTATKSLSPAELASLGMTRDELARTARENLAKHLGPLTVDGGAGPGTFGVVFRNDHFESSRLLLTEQWAVLARASGGKLLAAVPGNDVVVFALGSDPATLAKMQDVARAMMAKASRPVSDQVLTWTGDGWAQVKR